MPDEFDLSRRKALAALGTVGVASAGAGLGTSAFFSDREAFENNRLVAGTLDMGVGYTAHYSDWSDDEDDGLDGDVRMFDGGPAEVGSTDDLRAGEVGLPATDAWLIAVDEGDVEAFLDNTLTGAYPNVGTGTDPEQGPVACVDGEATPQADGATRPVIELEDVKPGDFGVVSFDFVLCDNPGYVWVNGGLRSASENGTTEPEADDPDEGAGVELLDVVQAALWIESLDGGDGPVGGLFQSDDGLLAVGSLRDVLGLGSGGVGTALNGDVPAEQGGGTGRNCFSAETTHSLAFAWWVPIDHGNEVQSDSVTFDLGLYVEQCRHNDGSGLDEFPTSVAETFLESVDVGDDGVVFFAGPVESGMVVADASGAALHLPDESGTYYVFVVDELPAVGYAHPVRFAWLDAESGATDTVEGEMWPQFGTEPQFEFPDEPRVVQGRSFFFATPAENVEPSVSAALDGDETHPNDTLPGDEFPGDVRPGDGRYPNIPNEKTDFTTQRNFALVIDGGLERRGGAADPDDDGNDELWSAETIAGWGAKVRDWIETGHDEDNFQVQRISQYWGRANAADNDPPPIPGPFESQPVAAGGLVHGPSQAVDNLEAVFGMYEAAFRSASQIELGPAPLHFVLVVIAHGAENDPDQNDGTEPSQEDAWFKLCNPNRTGNPLNEYAGIPWKGRPNRPILLTYPHPDEADETITVPTQYETGIKQWLERFPDYVTITVIALSCFTGEAENALDDVADWIVTSAGPDRPSHSNSIEAFHRGGRRLSQRYQAMRGATGDIDGDRRPENENEQRYPDDGILGPLDRPTTK